MTVLAGALGAHVAASSAPIVLLLGVNRLGQAAVITRRALASGIPFAREKDGRVFLAGQPGRQRAPFDGARTPPAGFDDGPYDTRRDEPRPYADGRRTDTSDWSARPASTLDSLGASLRDARSARRRARRSSRRPW
jgi:hypothetical protein